MEMSIKCCSLLCGRQIVFSVWELCWYSSPGLWLEYFLVRWQTGLYAGTRRQRSAKTNLLRVFLCLTMTMLGERKIVSSVVFCLFLCPFLVFVSFFWITSTVIFFMEKNKIVLCIAWLIKLSSKFYYILHHRCCSAHGSHAKLTCAELDSASNRHLLMRSVATLCAMAGFDSEYF